MNWYEIKGYVSGISGFSMDVLHVHVGLILFLILWRLTRRTPPIAPWLWLLGLELVNEALDQYQWYQWTETVKWAESLGDLFHTMLWPSLILVYTLIRRKTVEEETWG
jgi:hypothetical protein